ncbi:MAG: aldo/keto reductase, partial [Bacteroidetes bacterium]
EEKLSLMRKWFECTEKPVMIDSAGKYGAGLALEVIGKGLEELGIDPGDIIISNKLGWFRVPLTTPEPTFEPGAWAGLEYDCIQRFGYEGIMECFEQGNELLGGKYRAGLVSVHDPDEYLFAASGEGDRTGRFVDILESYRALFDLKEKGMVRAVGIGAKDWRVIQELYEHVPFDWVMFANSFTILSHPAELIRFMDRLGEEGAGMINSAVFHGGFLTGGSRFNYREVDPHSEEGSMLLAWREAFQAVCNEWGVATGDACIRFGISHPAVAGIALNTSQPGKMEHNVTVLRSVIPSGFWEDLKREGLIDPEYPFI